MNNQPPDFVKTLANKPKIGIALSGSSGRAIAHIGVLEVLKEHNIPIDIIVGCSSGAMVATTFCLGNMNVLKEWFYKMTLTKLLSIWSVSIINGGLLHLDKADPVLKTFTQDKNFEDVKDKKLAFVATDLNTGELVVLDKGDLNKSFKAASAVPGLFDPIIIDNRVLVDGGLVNIVPTDVVKNLGADIVIGVNIAATKFIYEKRLPIWKGYRFITKALGLQFLRQIFSKLASRVFFQFDSQSDTLAINDIKSPNAFIVLSQALDLAVKASENHVDQDIHADIMLEPRVKHYGKVEMKRLGVIYQEGRRATEQAIPEIKKLIENFQK